MLSCQYCPIGEFCVAGAIVGERCPTNFTTLHLGASSLDGCGCFSGLYEITNKSASSNRSCVTCPPGTACVESNVKLAALPLAQGYWRLNADAHDVRRCFTEHACIGGNNVTRQCNSSQTGPFCSVCADGYYGSDNSQLCELCAGNAILPFVPGVIILVLALALVIHVGVQYRRGQSTTAVLKEAANVGADALVNNDLVGVVEDEVIGKAEHEAVVKQADARSHLMNTLIAKLSGLQNKVRILIALYQMLGGVGIVFSIPYPPFYTAILHWMSSIIEMDLPKAMPLGCIFDYGFFGRILTRTLVPIAIIIILVVAGRVLQRKNQLELARLCSTAWFYVIFLVYPSCSSVIFQAFICDPLEDGSEVLRVDCAIVCWQGEHITIAIYAFLMLFVYPLGTPTFFAALLYVHGDLLQKIARDEVIIAADILKADQRRRSIASPSAPADEFTDKDAEHRASNAKNAREKLPPALKMLTDPYQMRCYWFEVFECARKVLIVGLPVLLPAGSSTQLILGLLVCFITMAMFSTYAPHGHAKDNTLSQVCQISLFFSLTASIALKTERDSSTNALAVILVILLAVPPALTFIFQSDLNFEQGFGVSKILKFAWRIFQGTAGKCLIWLLSTPERHALLRKPNDNETPGVQIAKV